MQTDIAYKTKLESNIENGFQYDILQVYIVALSKMKLNNLKMYTAFKMIKEKRKSKSSKNSFLAKTQNPNETGSVCTHNLNI